MEKQDYYEALGVSKNADEAALKKAYRRMALKYHPDKNSGDKKSEQKFKEISEAYDILKDKDKRAAYDRFGHSAFEGGGPAAGAAGGAGGGGTGFSDIFDEMFGDFMGGGTRRHRASHTKGSDLRYDLTLSLEEAFVAHAANIQVTSWNTCGSCRGNGAAKDTVPENCRTCQGAGRIRAQQGFFTVEQTCPTCEGRGQIIRNPCRKCQGTGRTRKTKSLDIKIPAGVETGTRIRLAGEGDVGFRAGLSGDLYVFIKIREHTIFQRDGVYLHCRVPVKMTDAALGGYVDIPTIEGGRSRINIPHGTQTGQKFRLKGKGMSTLGSAMHGDMYVEIIVETPVNLTKEQQDLLKEFDQHSNTERTSPRSSGFFTKVKDFWSDLTE